MYVRQTIIETDIDYKTTYHYFKDKINALKYDISLLIIALDLGEDSRTVYTFNPSMDIAGFIRDDGTEMIRAITRDNDTTKTITIEEISENELRYPDKLGFSIIKRYISKHDKSVYRVLGAYDNMLDAKIALQTMFVEHPELDQELYGTEKELRFTD